MMKVSQFGNDFIWGAACSAYQTEGSHNVDGKGESIWDRFCRKPGKIKQGESGNVSCDFYNRYMHDLILMDYMNIRNFRFSLSWPRIIPEGTGKANYKGLDFYSRMVDFCLELDIEPWVTLYHWDLPQVLEDKGGWTNRDIVHWFADYVQLCIHRLGDRVKYWMVLNEPTVFTGAGYYLGIHAPGKKGLSNFLPAVHHAALCQGIGGHIIRSYNGLKAGTTFSFSHIDALSDSDHDIKAAQNVDVIANRMLLEPMLGLGYPLHDLKLLQRIEKYMRPEDPDIMKCDMDFIGVQNYTREVVKYTPFVPYIQARLINANQRKVPSTTMDWEVFPESMYKILKKLSNYKQISKMIVTENGAAFNDILDNGKVEDHKRVSFLQSYIQQVLKAKNEGVPVSGYFTWSLTDNFEWAEGYRQRFGLVYVDYATQRRYIKRSGHWFRNFLSVTEKELQQVAV